MMLTGRGRHQHGARPEAPTMWQLLDTMTRGWHACAHQVWSGGARSASGTAWRTVAGFASVACGRTQ
jgi:hypothetical protein